MNTMRMLTTVKTIAFRSSLKQNLPIVSQRRWLDRTLSIHKSIPIDFTKVNVSRNIHDDKDIEHFYNEPEESFSELEEYSDMFQDQDMPIPVRNVLYATPIDYLMTRLNNCASVQEVFDLLQTNESNLRHEHIAQSVLVLWDLQKMFYHVNLMNNTLTNQSNIITDLANNYYRQLSEHHDFKLLLSKINQHCDKYDSRTLSVILLYLDRIGMDFKADLIQLLITTFNEKSKGVSICALSRFTTILFRNVDLSSYYYIKDYIPTILNHIENSKTLEEFKQCTLCLNNIQKLLTNDTMDRYTRMLRKHLKSGFLGGFDPKAVLRIVMFLNYPQWRDSNTQIIAETILLMKDKVHLLNSYELLLFYEVFSKIQEPAVILNELQRHASRYLALFEDEAVPLLDVRLRLMLALTTHSSHRQRAHYVRMLEQHTAYHLNRTSIFQFYKLLVFSKTSNPQIGKKLWSTITHLLDTDKIFRNNSLLKVCTSYLHYTQDVSSYRYYKLEKRINELLEKEILNGYVMLYPARFTFVATYIIVFGQSKEILDIVINRLEKFKDRLSHIECLNYTKALNFAKEIKSPLLTQEYIYRIHNLINHAVLNNIKDGDTDINVNSVLLKCCIYNADSLDRYSELLTKLIDKFGENCTFSTRIIKNLAFCLYSTQSLVPKVLDDMVDYIVKSKDNVLGFNAEKVLHLCYQLGYQPKSSQEFFEATTEIILRDQERFSGLSYLQCCLALCYFQSLPNSFIKQIFNTVFLDKLDIELANCYHKDVYPMRVRNLMMQLNRAVCIDYPNLNIPWFHQKYINEGLKRASLQKQDSMMQKLTRMYLNKILPGNGYLQENVITPYGYYINFVLNLDEDDQFIKVEDLAERTSFKKYLSSTDCPKIIFLVLTNRIALLLLNRNDYTNVQRQLMGKTILKMRHLEILGYDVILLDIYLWRNIVSGFEKIEYLRKLINVPTSQVRSTRNL